MKAPLLFVSITTFFLLVTASYAQPPMGGPMMGPGMMGGGGMMGNPGPRHPYVRQHGLPEAYRNLHNPLRASPDNVAAGKQLFTAQCAACHGEGGRGNGPAAAALNPPPSDLSLALHTPIATDAYLYWTIGEGGAPVGSAMPAYKENLQADEAWKIILYLRTL